MNAKAEAPVFFWFLDWNQDMSTTLWSRVRTCCREVSAALPSNVVMALTDWEKNLPQSPKRRPQILVTDHLATRPMAGGKCFADRVRADAPETVIILHSEAVASAELQREHEDPACVAEWRRTHLIQHYVPKGDDDGERLIRLIVDCVNRLQGSFMHRVRAFVAQHPEPNTKYFEDGMGNYLSARELLREYVAGTEVGEEIRRVWEVTLRTFDHCEPIAGAV